LDFLRCISIDKAVIVNEALFISGLNSFLKCFKPSNARCAITKADFINGDTNVALELKYFESLRDKHFMHDENSMIQTAEFLLLHPQACAERLGPASVVWNKKLLNYYSEAERLKALIYLAYNFVVGKIDYYGDKIIERYKDLPYEELRAFGVPKIKLASKDNISKNRI